MKKCNWIWLDLETTGLDPRAPGARILEVAATLAHDSAEGDMTPFSDFAVNEPVKTTRDQFSAAWAGMSLKDAALVRDMHTYNGLIGACINAARTIEQVDDVLVELARALTCASCPKDVVIAGDSVHFDLGWIRVHLPKFAACLSHRVYNVSTLKACARTWGAWPERLKKDEVHRAMADVLASLEAARIFKVDYRARIEAAKAWQKSQATYIAAGPIPIGVCVATFPTDGSAKGRGVYERGGVLYPASDPGPDHELISADDARKDPRAEYRARAASGGVWHNHWSPINQCMHNNVEYIYAFRRPKAKWVACTRAEAHAFGGQLKHSDGTWLDCAAMSGRSSLLGYRVDATRTSELSPVAVVSKDLAQGLREVSLSGRFTLTDGRVAIDRETIPVGTYLG